jgi:outer membrane protein assembly factor BamB/tetratricopeptide (TPR) repeat protein
MAHSPVHRAGLFAILFLALSAALPAAPEPGDELEPETGGDLFDAYDAKMNRLLDDGDAAAAAGDFAKASAAYQDAADRAAGQVRRVGKRTWLGIREYVNTRVASWSEEGRGDYRKLVDPRAAEAVEGSLARGDERKLGEAARRFALSSHGARARLALGTRALVRGDHDEALRHLLEILRLYPDGAIPAVERADVLARAALAASRLGDGQLLDHLRGLAGRTADHDVAVGGEPRPLTGFLGRLEPAPAAGSSPPGYTTLGGSSARAGARDGPDGPLVLRWLYDLPPAEPTDDAPGTRADGQSPAFPFHPLIADGLVLAATHAAVYALRLPAPDEPAPPAASGLVPAELVFAFPSAGENEPAIFPREQAPVFATALDGRAWLPFRDSEVAITTYSSEDELALSRFVALSLERDGALLDQRGGIDPLHGSEFAEFRFCGAPAVSKGRVLTAANRAGGMVETWVLCFRDGGVYDALKPAFKTFVCRGRGRRVGDFGFEPVDASSIALRHGVAYVCSNSGAVSALDAESGEILWCCSYEPARETLDIFMRDTISRRTFFVNPPALDDRFLFVAPLDADRLLSFFLLPDLATGFVERGRFPAEDVALGFSPEYLVGVRDGTAFLAGSCRARGETPLFAVRAFGTGSETSRVKWRAPVEESAPCGRPVLAGEAIYFPTEKAIYRVSIADGSATKLVDLTTDELADLSGRKCLAGNLAVAGPWLVSAGEDFIALFGPPPPP